MMTVALMRPRVQLGMARCAATQSSEAEKVHPAPASAATTRKSSLWRTSAIRKGRDATVETRESKNVEEPSMFIVQEAVVSCAATHVPESKMADQSFR